MLRNFHCGAESSGQEPSPVGQVWDSEEHSAQLPEAPLLPTLKIQWFC